MFKGSLPALVTPFTADGELDLPALERLVEWHLEQGSDGLVPVGTTGESPTLTHEEHRLVVQRVVEIVAGRIPVMAGAGSNSTREAIGLVQFAQEVGADAALVVTPYYNRPSQAGMQAHFEAVADAVQLPILLYNVPARTGADLANETVARLAARPGVKSPGNHPIPSLDAGDRVTSDSFGLGTVVRLEGTGDRTIAHIDFGGDYGVKRLALRYGKVEKL